MLREDIGIYPFIAPHCIQSCLRNLRKEFMRIFYAFSAINLNGSDLKSPAQGQKSVWIHLICTAFSTAHI